MSASLWILCLFLFVMMSIVTLIVNGFIIAVNCYSWLRSQKSIPCGFLLTCLSISRFSMQGLLMINQYLYLSFPKTYRFSCTEQFIIMAGKYCNMAIFSSDTALNVFYCLKITTLPRPPFPWLKSRIDWLVPRLLVTPCIAFVAFSLPSYIAYVNQGQCYFLRRNITERRNPQTHEVLKMLVPVQFTLPALCFIICLAASIVLLVSLWRHMRNLKKNGLDVNDLSTRAHLNVMKSLLCFLFFFVAYFIVTNVALFCDFSNDSLEHLIAITLFSFYPSVHSSILIVTNPKLKEPCLRILNIGKIFSCSSSSRSAE